VPPVIVIVGARSSVTVMVTVAESESAPSETVNANESAPKYPVVGTYVNVGDDEDAKLAVPCAEAVDTEYVSALGPLSGSDALTFAVSVWFSPIVSELLFAIGA
jgi:hypothetical protein